MWTRCPAADKLEACEGQLSHSGRMGRFVSSGKKDASGDQQLHKICCDANKLALEHIKGMSGQVLTPRPFTRLCAAPSRAIPAHALLLLLRRYDTFCAMAKNCLMLSRLGFVFNGAREGHLDLCAYASLVVQHLPDWLCHSYKDDHMNSGYSVITDEPLCCLQIVKDLLFNRAIVPGSGAGTANAGMENKEAAPMES